LTGILLGASRAVAAPERIFFHHGSACEMSTSVSHIRHLPLPSVRSAQKLVSPSIFDQWAGYQVPCSKEGFPMRFLALASSDTGWSVLSVLRCSRRMGSNFL
jgi:hypothetical protein